MFAYIKKKLYLCNIEIKIITTASLKPKQVPKAWARNYDNFKESLIRQQSIRCHYSSRRKPYQPGSYLQSL